MIANSVVRGDGCACVRACVRVAHVFVGRFIFGGAVVCCVSVNGEAIVSCVCARAARSMAYRDCLSLGSQVKELTGR